MSFNNVEFYVISLKEHVDRRLSLKNKLNAYNVSCKVIDAVNGKKMYAVDYFSLFKAKSSKILGRKFLTPSELGCFLSHKKALTEFIKTGKSRLVVLEDDVTPNENFNEFLNVMGGLDSDGVYILGGQDGLNSFSRVLLGRRNNKTGFKKVLFGSHRWLYRTCCYCLDKKGVLEILSLMDKTRFFPDDWAYIMKETKIKKIFFNDYFSHPIDLGRSSIEAERLLMARMK